MAEKTLEELCELSKPALRHAELVEIARSETPSKADEMASIRWPRRQAKATRFLAMLRRDYGLGAFESLLLEHARINGPEHAQGDRMLTFDSVYPDGVRHLFFHISPGGWGQGLKTLEIAEYRPGWPHIKNDVLVEEEIKRLSLDKNQKKVLVRRVIESTYAEFENPQIAKSFSGDNWAAALVAIRCLLPEDQKLYRKVLLSTVIYLGAKSEHPSSFLQRIVPEVTDDERQMIQKGLQRVINYLLEQGCSETEVSRAWAEMLDKRSKQGIHAVLVYEWWAGLKIGKTEVDHFDTGIAQPAARHCARKELSWFLENDASDFGRHYGDIVEEDRMRVLKSMIGDCGMDWRRREGREMFEEMLTSCLARGQAGKAFYFFVRFGHSNGFRLHDREESIMQASELKSKFVPLIRGAIDKAKDENSFGVASALAEYISETEIADEFRELARRLKQRTTLDFMFYTYTPDRNYKE